MIERYIDRFLLCCVRARYDSEALDEARQIVRADDVDWDQMLRAGMALLSRKGCAHPRRVL
jgi:hypothetical protein